MNGAIRYTADRQAVPDSIKLEIGSSGIDAKLGAKAKGRLGV